MDNKELDLLRQRYEEKNNQHPVLEEEIEEIDETEQNELDNLINESEFSNSDMENDETEEIEEETEEIEEDEELDEPENIYLPYKICLLCPAINSIGRVYQNKEGKTKVAELEEIDCQKLNTESCPACKIRLKLGNPEENAVDYVTAEMEKDINTMNKIAKKVETYDKETQEYFFDLVALLREQQ